MPGIPSFGGDSFGGGDPPLNALHTMLQSCFYQSQPVLGSSLTIAGNTVDAIVSSVDERIQIEMEGYLSDADFIAVVSTADFTSPPIENTQVASLTGDNYLVRGVKTDPSAFILALKKISI